VCDLRGAIVTKSGKQKKSIFYPTIKKFIIIPLTGGFFGYFTFLLVIVLTKYLGYLIGIRNSFYIDKADILLSLIGFFLIFVVRLSEKIITRN
jgi:hypothetical protein